MCLVALLAAAVGYGQKSDEVLIRRALDGHKGAMRMLVRRLVPVIRSRVSAYLGRRGGRLGHQDVDDLTQEIWLTLMDRDGHLLRSYDADRGKSLEGYVGLTCRRELWRRNRSLNAERRGGGQDDAPLEAAATTAGDSPDPESIAMGRDLMNSLQSHLEANLAERGRLVLAAIYEDQRSPAETAELMGVRQQVVYNWMHKIRTLTRDYLGQAGIATP